MQVELSDEAVEEIVVSILKSDLDIAEGEDRKAIIGVLKYYMRHDKFEALKLSCTCECTCGVK